MSDLKPCSCGGNAKFYNHNPSGWHVIEIWITCDKCYRRLPVTLREVEDIMLAESGKAPRDLAVTDVQIQTRAKELLLVLWNNRPIEDALNAKIARLEGKIEGMQEGLGINAEGGER